MLQVASPDQDLYPIITARPPRSVKKKPKPTSTKKPAKSASKRPTRPTKSASKRPTKSASKRPTKSASKKSARQPTKSVSIKSALKKPLVTIPDRPAHLHRKSGVKKPAVSLKPVAKPGVSLKPVAKPGVSLKPVAKPGVSLLTHVSKLHDPKLAKPRSKLRIAVKGHKLDSKISLVTCLDCGRVHVQRLKFEAKDEIENLNEFLRKAPPELAELFGTELASIKDYERCFGCGNNYKLFRETEEADSMLAQTGAAITPILDRFE